ncbi:MAG: bifunctional UDP-3-O-[3-hydroxymyristoyl] N-acetylglucosamine deacetylase/3-hydroxyacyl-ACP dehydratase [Chitinivibrionia bacterium]|nr:bifunctional UDP-3-O-[3-hydroxymyristoyl] N-acetylglucosamine deacetylase/3-hydroxyacyl-ACP dehydratase [Chitinivibrionia bacterium]
MKQKTIKKSCSFSGTGLHTGVQVSVTLNPAKIDDGIKFVRIDTPEKVEIPADIDYIVGDARGTAIGIGDVKVFTIEHLMAALAAKRISNCRIEINAEEVPIMDGSAKPFIELIAEAGEEEQDAEQEYIEFDEPMWLYNENNIALSVFPANNYYITLMVDYKSPIIGAQHTTMFDFNNFEVDFAPSRTFCFLSEVETLAKQGLIKGGNLDSAMVVQDIPIDENSAAELAKSFPNSSKIFPGTNGFLSNRELRFPNELCRHKAVDLVGDLYLLGKPIKGHIMAARSGHSSNQAFAKRIREYLVKRAEKEKANKITFEDIMKMLPHRYPFLLVDGVDEVVPGQKIVAYKNVSFNDHFFQGHFPGNPIMPGVLQLEALAQAGGIMVLCEDLHNEKADAPQKSMLYMGIDNCKFRNPVRPGDKLILEVNITKQRRNIFVCTAKAKVGKKVTCEAELTCMINV